MQSLVTRFGLATIPGIVSVTDHRNRVLRSEDEEEGEDETTGQRRGGEKRGKEKKGKRRERL